ncbi:translin-associated protein X isoform X1 [Callorhinchus milii]|uniref:Translin-associated protein X n=1 Tax=Callorhinchus milii TaxID=7868 RepID=V9KLH3_CALMI|nr:translin-associated protein X isoform X1 [Callorhinchus milii]|eukprot:gi/632952781/ref/XP_007892045.1/ PREDICTED: translin-associated protein X isoform X1 [Callorhinchus milii]
MSKEGGFRKRKHENMQSRNRKEENENKVNSSSPVLLSFKSFQNELDARHDKHERLVKLSRDVTIESKRTIFLLQRVTSVPEVEDLLNESESKFEVIRQKIKQIAQELVGEDMHQFHRAFSPGIQEYVEAVSFQHFIRSRSLISLEEINKCLVFTPKKEEQPGDSECSTLSNSEAENQNQQVLCLQVTPTDYLLGIADLTGELMRMCISSVGNGDVETPFEVSQFLRDVYYGFTYIGNTGPYEVSKKLYTLKQSLAKVEDACYTLTVRGSEIPKHMLADVLSSKTTMIQPEEAM